MLIRSQTVLGVVMAGLTAAARRYSTALEHWSRHHAHIDAFGVQLFLLTSFPALDDKAPREPLVDGCGAWPMRVSRLNRHHTRGTRRFLRVYDYGGLLLLPLCMLPTVFVDCSLNFDVT